MRVIDIINEANNTNVLTPTKKRSNYQIAGQEKTLTIARNWNTQLIKILDVNAPDRPTVLDDTQEPTMQITSEKIDQNAHGIKDKLTPISERLNAVISAISNSSTEPTDTQMEELRSCISNIAIVQMQFRDMEFTKLKNDNKEISVIAKFQTIDKFNVLMRYLNQFEQGYTTPLKPNGYYISKQLLDNLPKNLQSILGGVTNLVNEYKKNATYWYNRLSTTDATQYNTAIFELRNVNEEYISELEKINKKIKLIKNKPITREENEIVLSNRSVLSSVIQQVKDFINSEDSDMLLFQGYSYTRGMADTRSLAELETWVNRAEANAKNQKPSELIKTLDSFLKGRRRGYASRSKISKLGPLPTQTEGYDHNDPLHRRWALCISEAESRCKKTGRKFDVTYNSLWPIFLKQQGLCYLTNETMTDNGHYQVSIDRIDSTQGYVYENIAFCCFQVNRIKGNLLNNELIALCKQIVNFNTLSTGT